MGEAEAPFVSIIVPVLDEERYVAGAIASLIPKGGKFDCEILVMDGGSSDMTIGIVELLSAGDKRIRLVPNEKRLQSAAVNIGARVADPRSRYILRADCHAQYPAGFVSSCLEAICASGAASVVVPMRTVGFSCFQRAVAAAQNSRLGNGGSAHRRGSASGYIDHGHHALFDRETFLSVGGYDETFSHNEDAEYDVRLGKAGHKIWMAGDAVMTYFPRASVSSLARQYFNYGYGRASTTLKHRLRMKPRQLLPVFAALGCGGSLVASLVFPWAALVPLLYLGACVAAGVHLGLRERSLCVALFAGVASVTMHMAWAAGFLTRLREQIGRSGFGSPSAGSAADVLKP
jgi:succinoglycan biosynthesis protein ExoA